MAIDVWAAMLRGVFHEQPDDELIRWLGTVSSKLDEIITFH